MYPHDLNCIFKQLSFEISQEIFIGPDIIFTIGRSAKKKKKKGNEIDCILLTGERNGLDNFFTFASRNSVQHFILFYYEAMAIEKTLHSSTKKGFNVFLSFFFA